jgi:uncharacterized protein YehS (DUF1456 family)
MDNNDIFRRLRYTLGYNDQQMVEVFAETGTVINQESVTLWLKKHEDPQFLAMSDVMLATFLNGLINKLRGKKDGPQPAPEKTLNNNIIFRKLRIAFNLQSDDILELFSSIDKSISEHELSAFFRKPTSSKYRECNDQYLRYFLSGLQKKFENLKIK